MTQSKKSRQKGQAKLKPDNDNPELNPLLRIEDKDNFSITTSNLLQTPDSMILPGYEDFDLKKEKDQLDFDRLKDGSKLVIMLRYYEYLCTAEMTFSYIVPLMMSGLTGKDVFDMVKHSLKTRLLCNVPSFDSVFEPDIVYTGKILYN